MYKTSDGLYKVKSVRLPYGHIITEFYSSMNMNPNSLRKVFIRRGQNVIGLYNRIGNQYTCASLPLIVLRMSHVMFSYVRSTNSVGSPSFITALTVHLLVCLFTTKLVCRLMPMVLHYHILCMILTIMNSPLFHLSGLCRINISQNCPTIVYSIMQQEASCWLRIATLPQCGQLLRSLEKAINIGIMQSRLQSIWNITLFFLTQTFPRFRKYSKVIRRYTTFIWYRKRIAQLV